MKGKGGGVHTIGKKKMRFGLGFNLGDKRGGWGTEKG